MSTREDYPAGVACWAGTSQPGPRRRRPVLLRALRVAGRGRDAPRCGSSLLHGPHRRPGCGRDLLAAPRRTAAGHVEHLHPRPVRCRRRGPGARGGRVLSGPFDVFDAGRTGVFADPGGAVFCVWQPGSHRGSAAVNEHGAVNSSNLHTGDAGAARAFYGAVFGWTMIDAGSPMWALPGYGDHLEELNPGLRAGMRQMGAPEGFENVVATVLSREGGALERDLRRRGRGRDRCAGARARRPGPRRAAQCAVGAIRRPCRSGWRVLHRQPVRGGEPLDDPLPGPPPGAAHPRLLPVAPLTAIRLGAAQAAGPEAVSAGPGRQFCARDCLGNTAAARPGRRQRRTWRSPAAPMRTGQELPESAVSCALGGAALVTPQLLPQATVCDSQDPKRCWTT